MSAHFRVDVAAGRIERARGEMALAAFDGTPDTGFESCRDILSNVGDLEGLALDGGLVREIRHAIGRSRGCYHLSTLVLASAPVMRGLLTGSLPGSASWSRRLTLSGIEVRAGRYRFEGKLVDARPGSAASPVQLRFEVEASEMELLDVSVRSGPEAAGDPASEALLGGMSLASGFAPALLARAAGSEREALRELALGLSSIVTQVLIAQPVSGSKEGVAKPQRAKDTCWMWRQGGPLQRMEVGVGDEPPLEA